MTGDEDRLQNIRRALDRWLQPDNRELKRAIDQTVRSRLFSFEDITFQILHLKESIRRGELEKWAHRHRAVRPEYTDKRVVALHAGNLPLVGFQDMLAILLSGASYSGKLSRKDPWLPASFLQTAEREGLSDLVWTENMEDLAGTKADALLFSGSEHSVPPVRDTVNRLHILSPDAPMLIRTAHYSAAWIGDLHAKTMKDLVAAAFRYGGRGCRSVAVVFSPYSLQEISCTFTDYVESFWLRNPQHDSPPPSLAYRAAYNHAAGVTHSWLGHFLIEERAEVPEENFILSWNQGSPDDLIRFLSEHGAGLQSLYLPAGTEEALMQGSGVVPEPLYTAQKPPLYWKPDGVDTLDWLARKLQPDQS